MRAAGPKDETMVHFWRMVWQENVSLMVMIALLNENGQVRIGTWSDCLSSCAVEVVR
jgi:protein tyrosine phosphatase